MKKTSATSRFTHTMYLKRNSTSNVFSTDSCTTKTITISLKIAGFYYIIQLDKLEFDELVIVGRGLAPAVSSHSGFAAGASPRPTAAT